MPSTVGIVLAAGNARRMGENKMLMHIGAKSVLQRTLCAFETAACCDRIVIVCRPEDAAAVSAIAKAALSVPFQTVDGGEERQYSVENALLAVPDADIVVVHDGARCFIDPDVIRTCTAVAAETGAAAAGVRTKDTIKQTNSDIITGTIDRTSLVNIQTPQAFAYTVLMNAHKQAPRQRLCGYRRMHIAGTFGHSGALCGRTLRQHQGHHTRRY